ncbi:hypothetical protein ACFX2A_043251 [Malus domestica]
MQTAACIPLPKLYSNLLKKLNDIGVESGADDAEAFESRSLSQGLKLLLRPLFSSGVVTLHDHVEIDNSLGGQAAVCSYWKNAFSKNLLPIVRECSITVLQKFQAMIVTLVVTYRL